MKFKFAVEDTVEVPVKFTVKNGGVDNKMNFTLVCKRMESGELKSTLEGDEKLTKEFVLDVTTDWKGQRFLVEEATGNPAEFSREALEALLSFPGLANMAFISYLKENGAKEKN